MPKYIFLTLLLIPTLNLQSDSFSVMTFNVENLFDTQDDYKKDDKAFLPLAKKQLNKHKQSCNRIRVKVWKDECLYLDWSEPVKDAKLNNILNLIIAYEGSGPDVIVFQEIENNNILQQLFTLLKP